MLAAQAGSESAAGSGAAGTSGAVGLANEGRSCESDSRSDCSFKTYEVLQRRHTNLRPVQMNYNKEIRFIFRFVVLAVLPRTGGTHLRPMATGCLLNKAVVRFWPFWWFFLTFGGYVYVSADACDQHLSANLAQYRIAHI